MRKDWPYYLSFIYIICVLWYSFFLYTGVKEGHIGHLVLACLVFPLVAFPLSKRLFMTDLTFFCLFTFMIVFAGYLYWEFQDSISSADFSFENEYMPETLVMFALAGFATGELLKAIINWLRSRSGVKN